jgi:hypothetical protein
MILNKNMENIEKIKNSRNNLLNFNNGANTTINVGRIAYETLGFGDRMSRKGIF